MLYTTYFANLRNLPENITPIAICSKSPEGYKGLEYKKLAPKWSFFSVWRETGDNQYYVEHFDKEVLESITSWYLLREATQKLLWFATRRRRSSATGIWCGIGS